jgi:hypothetical protein
VEDWLTRVVVAAAGAHVGAVDTLAVHAALEPGLVALAILLLALGALASAALAVQQLLARRRALQDREVEARLERRRTEAHSDQSPVNVHRPIEIRFRHVAATCQMKAYRNPIDQSELETRGYRGGT